MFAGRWGKGCSSASVCSSPAPPTASCALLANISTPLSVFKLQQHLTDLTRVRLPSFPSQGAAIAVRCAVEGASVVLVARHADQLQQVNAAGLHSTALSTASPGCRSVLRGAVGEDALALSWSGCLPQGNISERAARTLPSLRRASN